MIPSELKPSSHNQNEHRIDNTNNSLVKRTQYKVVSLKKRWGPIPTEPPKMNHLEQKRSITVSTVLDDETDTKSLTKKTEKTIYPFIIEAQKRKSAKKSERLETFRHLYNSHQSKGYSNEQETEESIHLSTEKDNFDFNNLYPSTEKDNFDFNNLYPSTEKDNFDFNNPYPSTEKDNFDFNDPTNHIGLLAVFKALKIRKELKLPLNDSKSNEEQKKSELILLETVDAFTEKLERYEKLFEEYERSLSVNESTEKTPGKSINGETLSFQILRNMSMYLTALEIIKVNYRELLDVPLFDLGDTENDSSEPLKTWLDVMDHTDRSNPLFLQLFSLPPSKRKSSYENPPASLNSESLLELTSEEQISRASNAPFNELRTTSPSFSKNSEEIFGTLKIHKILCTLFIFLNTELPNTEKSFSLGIAFYQMKDDDKIQAYSMLSKAPPVVVTYFLLYSNSFIREEIFRTVSDASLLFSWIEQAFKNNWTDEEVNEFLMTFPPQSRNSFLEYFEKHTSKELKDWILKNHKNFFDPAPEIQEVSNGCACYCS